MLEQFVAAYITCAVWAENLGCNQLSDDAKHRMQSDCRTFWGTYHDFIECNPQQAGHDFWLTRTGAGCGFWDGDWSEPSATILTNACKQFGHCDLYVGDDNLIYAA